MKLLKILALFLFGFSTSLFSQRVISGKVSQNNPSINCIFTGFATQQQRAILSFLKNSGWLSLQQKVNTDYSIKLNANGNSVTALITGVKNTRLNMQIKSGRTNEQARFIADQIIAAIFGPNAKVCDSRIAFSGLHNGRKEIFTMNIDGSDIRQVTNYKSRSVEVDWSSDNKSLAFTTYTADGTTIIHKDLASQKHRVLARYKGLNSGASFSPDGKYIALTLSKGSHLNLYWKSLSNIKKGGPITNDKRINSSPTWSPDGGLLCYVSSSLSSNKRIGTPKLYLTAPNTSTTRALFKDGRERVSPDWSATSGLLTYAKKMGRDYAIAICNPRNPSTEKILTKLAGSWEAPSWAPDGRHIVCSRSLNGRNSLCIIDSKSDNKVRQITLPFQASLPSWSGIMNK